MIKAAQYDPTILLLSEFALSINGGALVQNPVIETNTKIFVHCSTCCQQKRKTELLQFVWTIVREVKRGGEKGSLITCLA